MYKTFTEWKNGNWLEDGEPRKEAYTKDELLLIEMGWKYGFDAGKAQQADRIAELEKYATNGNEILVDCDTHIDKLQKLVLEKDKELKRYKMAWTMAENELEAQTKPLSNDEILEMTIWNKNLYELYVEMDKEDIIAFARAIEERHGIK